MNRRGFLKILLGVLGANVAAINTLAALTKTKKVTETGYQYSIDNGNTWQALMENDIDAIRGKAEVLVRYSYESNPNNEIKVSAPSPGRIYYRVYEPGQGDKW